MHAKQPSDSWTSGDAYQKFMGRWSPFLAELFVPWVCAPAGSEWLDVGCGTGALTRTILKLAEPVRVVGVDPSEAFVGFARQNVSDPRATFQVGGAQDLPVEDASFDVAAAGLVINFVPSPATALAEMKRAVLPGGMIGCYVWDYAEGMRMIRVFFDAAVALDPAAKDVDEGRRFELCNPTALTKLFNEAGLQGVETRALEFTMQFRDFADYWTPYRGGVGPAPAYLASLPPERQAGLEAEVRKRLPIAADGSLQLAARAWAVKGRK
jgi:SAM-dependent methyltransferase